MRLTEVRLTSSEPAEAARWYAAFLGLHCSRLPLAASSSGDGSASSEAWQVQVGATNLILEPGVSGPGAHHLAFTVQGAGFGAAARTVAERAGLLSVGGRHEFEGPPGWDSRSVYFSGPDGSVLELIDRRGLDRSGPVEPSGAGGDVGIISISEVEVAVADVPETVAEVADVFGAAPFGRPAPDFSPVGDQDGLLIIVREGRLWFPEESRPAGGGPLGVRIGSAGAGVLTVDEAGVCRAEIPGEAARTTQRGSR